ncbi:MAG: RNA methyltransferase [Clostridia bacterium]|nr:RNA methyltransferase [Clostridia bacterium]
MNDLNSTFTENIEERAFFEGMISFRSVAKAIREKNSDRKIEAVYFDTNKKVKLSKHLSYIKAMSHELSFPLYFIEADEISAMTNGNSHGGILTVCTKRTYPVLDKADMLKKDGFYIMLDGVEDPYNFAFSVRAAYAAGADGLILPERNWMSAAGTVCRSSAGASELIDTMIFSDKTLKAFKRAGYRIVCTALENSLPLGEADLSKPLLAVIGGERRGISSNIMAEADEIVRIEYGRNDFNESLPAASASAIFSFEILRRNS